MTVKFSLTDGTAYELNRVAEVVDTGFGFYTFKPYKGATILVTSTIFRYEEPIECRQYFAGIKGGITII